MKLGYLGIDQYGDKYTISEHPRKELMEQLGATHADKMYVDGKDGDNGHQGYVMRGLWIRVYEVHQWKGLKPAHPMEVFND